MRHISPSFRQGAVAVTAIATPRGLAASTGSSCARGAAPPNVAVGSLGRSAPTRGAATLPLSLPPSGPCRNDTGFTGFDYYELRVSWLPSRHPRPVGWSVGRDPHTSLPCASLGREVHLRLLRLWQDRPGGPSSHALVCPRSAAHVWAHIPSLRPAGGCDRRLQAALLLLRGGQSLRRVQPHLLGRGAPGGTHPCILSCVLRQSLHGW